VARAWTTSDGPQALFDRATAWLIDRKVLLPGVTVLARMVPAVRAEAAERLWQQLTEHIDPELRCRLDALLNVEDGARFSTLERLRTSPTRLSGPETAHRRLPGTRCGCRPTLTAWLQAQPLPGLLRVHPIGTWTGATTTRPAAADDDEDDE
jgi:hypothetical protein